MSSEKRKKERTAVSIPIEIAIREKGGRGGTEEKVEARLFDVSSGGFGADSPVSLPIGTVALARVPLLGIPHEERAKVVWAAAEGGGTKLGLAFFGGETGGRSALLDAIIAVERYREAVKEKEGRELSPEEAAQEWMMTRPLWSDDPLMKQKIVEERAADLAEGTTARNAWTIAGFRRDVIAFVIACILILAWLAISVPRHQLRGVLSQITFGMISP